MESLTLQFNWMGKGDKRGFFFSLELYKVLKSMYLLSQYAVTFQK